MQEVYKVGKGISLLDEDIYTKEGEKE